MTISKQLTMWAYAAGGNLNAGAFCIVFPPTPWSVLAGAGMMAAGIFAACYAIGIAQTIDSEERKAQP